MAEDLPAGVRLLLDFVNTADLQEGVEGLDKPEDLLEWCVEHGLLEPGEVVGRRDVAVVRDVREGLRAVLAGHAGHTTDEAAVQVLNDALDEGVVRVRFDGDGHHRLVSAGTDPTGKVLAGILDAVRQTSQDQTWERLKVCARDTCRWAFFDASRNRSGRWCSMAGCGNHVKMQRAYAARKARMSRRTS